MPTTAPTASEGIALGEGLIGQCAVDKRRMLISEMPRMPCRHLGAVRGPPRSIVVLPVLFESQVKAVIELASIHEFTTLRPCSWSSSPT